MPTAVAFELAIDVQAAPERVWAVMMEVERWPEWTASMHSVRRIEDGPLVPGKGVRIRQPGLLPVTWRVTELVAGERFTWVSRSPGLVSSASHALERRGTGTRVMLAVRHEGVLARLLRGWLARVTERYVTMEARGLAAHCER